MLRTLNNYLTDEPSADWLLEPVWRQIGRNPRFARIIAASIVCHIIFYVAIVAWSWHSLRRQPGPPGRQPELVKLTELAPPSDPLSRLRSHSEAIERADTTRFQYDPNTANDVNVISRSPKPTTARGAETKLPSATQIENEIKAGRGRGAAGESATSAVEPPDSTPLNPARLPHAETTIAASGIPAPNPPAPPAPPAAAKPAGSTPGTAAPAPRSGNPQGDSAETAAFGFRAAEAQYMAYVRTKIRTKNEQIMPRYYIETLLAKTVSSDFRIVIANSGQILSTDLIRSCGYKQLDDVARQAIQLAKPFEGFPPAAGDTITLTVTVYYTPGR